MILTKKKLLCFCAGLGLIAAILISCAPFQDSPYSDKLLSKQTNLNGRALEKIKNIESDGLIRIAVLADVHQNYQAIDNVIYSINETQKIDFVVNLGDFTNSGYNLEYDQYLDSYESLRHPAFTVIGNHDSIGAGPDLYRKAFYSELNFYFESATKRFIFFDSANLENPDDFKPQWLKDTISSSTKQVIIFTHCSLQDDQRYFNETAQLFNDVIADPKVDLILNGHNHVYNLANVSGTVLLQSARVEGGNWLLLDIQGTQMTIHDKGTGVDTVVTLKN